MDLALNNKQRLICLKTQTTNNQPHTFTFCFVIYPYTEGEKLNSLYSQWYWCKQPHLGFELKSPVKLM